MDIASRFKILLSQQRIRVFLKGWSYLIAFFFNILFFSAYRYLCQNYWPQLIKTHEKNKWHLYFFGTQAVMFLTHGLNFLFYDLIDYMRWFYDSKVVKTNLPWEVDKENWVKLRNRSLWYNFIVIAVIGPSLLFLDSFATKVRFDAAVPSVFEMMTQLYFLMTMEATFFFIFHWIGHEYLYKYHKLHHEFTVPCPLATNHTHPIDYIGTAIPFAIGIIILGDKLHYLTFIMWGVWRISQGYDGHSNYDFSWSPFRILPFSGSGDYHGFHHTHNVGNFGSLMFWQDTLMKQNTHYDEYMKTRLEKAKKM